VKITDISIQQKRKDRASIFLDKKYSFSLSIQQLEAESLKIGQELGDSDLLRLKRLSGFGKLYDRALQQLARRPRSEWEMRDYLRRKDASEEDIDQIIAKLAKLNYINDHDFTEAWVRSRRALKATSKRRLQQELFKKRVASDIIDAVLAEDEVSDYDSLIELIERKRRQTRYQDDQKLIAYLVRQGFNYQDVRSALDQAS